HGAGSGRNAGGCKAREVAWSHPRVLAGRRCRPVGWLAAGKRVCKDRRDADAFPTHRSSTMPVRASARPFLAAFLLFVVCANALAAAPAPQRITEVEGITEYRLDN